MISVVIPFVDAFDKLRPCIESVIAHASGHDYEIILWDNGSRRTFSYKKYQGSAPISYIRQKKNIGVLPVFKEATPYCLGDIIMFIHSDILVHGAAWDERIEKVFKDDDRLGLAGFFGAKGIGADGGRSYSISNMQGSVWGKCDCHESAAWHHGSPMTRPVEPATVLDGVALIFRRSVLEEIIDNTDMFAMWRAPHHFYDKTLSLKTVDLGYKVAVIDIEFDHWSGATANHSKKYDKMAREWAKAHGAYIEGSDGDHMVYKAAEKQLFDEFRNRLPVNVLNDYEYEWTHVEAA